MKKWLILVILLIAANLTKSGYSLAATSHLLINPPRVIFTERDRTITVNIGNPTDAPISYTIALITMRKDSDGKLQEIKDKNNETTKEQLSKSLIRFSPRRATVQPHKRQVVKLMVRKPTGLANGEYRTRLRVMPREQPAAQRTVQNSEAETSLIRLDLLIGVSIPIIIQHGPSTVNITPASIDIKQFAQTESRIAAQVTLSRKGNFSSFGDLSLTHTSITGEQKKIGRARGVAIYLPNDSKQVTVPLTNITATELTKGSIAVEFIPYQGQSKRKGRKSASVNKVFRL